MKWGTGQKAHRIDVLNNRVKFLHRRLAYVEGLLIELSRIVLQDKVPPPPWPPPEITEEETT